MQKTKTITITAPEGKVINFDESKGTVVFEDEPKSVIERIKTFEDVLKELGINHLNFLKDLEGLSSDEVAYRKIKLISKAYNEQWIPDWTNSSERKYYPWFEMGSPSGVGFSYNDCGYWCAASDVGSRLCFKTVELAKHAGTQFEELYKDYFVLSA
jgi:hypothetical protein